MSRILFPIFVVAAALGFLLRTALDQPPNWDQSDFYAAAKAASETGVPLYSVARNRPPLSGLWHPPLYVHGMGAVFRLLGDGLLQARLLGIAGLAAGLIGLWALTRLDPERPPEERARLFTAALALIATTPYFLQGAILLDIDNTLLAPLLLAFCATYLRLDRAGRSGIKPHLGLAVLLAIALWTKTTTPLLLPVAAAGYQCLRKRWREAAYAIGIVGCGGMLLCILTFLGYRRALDLPEWAVLNDNASIVRQAVATALADPAAAAGALGKRTGNLLAWLSPFYAGLTWINLRYWIRRYLAGSPGHPMNFLYFVAYGILGGYFLVRSDIYYYPKYVFPGLLLQQFLFAEMLLAGLGSHAGRIARIALPCALGLGAVYWMSLGDPLLAANDLKRSLSPESLPGLLAPAAKAAAILTLPALAVGMLLMRRTRALGLPVAGRWSVLLATGFLGYQLALAAAQYRAPYATTYYYGERGFWDTTRFLRENLGELDAFATPRRDLGVFSGKPCDYFDRDDLGELSRILKRPDVRFLVLADAYSLEGLRSRNLAEDLLAVPENRRAIEEHYRPIRRFGFFRIYRRTD